MAKFSSNRTGAEGPRLWERKCHREEQRPALPRSQLPPCEVNCTPRRSDRRATAGASPHPSPRWHRPWLPTLRASSNPSRRGTLGTVDPKDHGDAFFKTPYHSDLLDYWHNSLDLLSEEKTTEYNHRPVHEQGLRTLGRQGPCSSLRLKDKVTELREVPAGLVCRKIKCARLHYLCARTQG